MRKALGLRGGHAGLRGSMDLRGVNSVCGRTGFCAEGTLPARRELSKKLSEAGEDGRKPLTNALFRGIILQKSSLFIAVFAFFARKRRKEGAFLR